jgi:hypothetical protein
MPTSNQLGPCLSLDAEWLTCLVYVVFVGRWVTIERPIPCCRMAHLLRAHRIIHVHTLYNCSYRSRTPLNFSCYHVLARAGLSAMDYEL